MLTKITFNINTIFPNRTITALDSNMMKFIIFNYIFSLVK